MNDEDRQRIEDAVCNKYGLDIPDVEHLTDSELLALFHGSKPEPVEPEPVQPLPPVKQQTRAPLPRRKSWEYVEHGGNLCRLETWSDGSQFTITCGERVPFEGRTVSAAIVLHWLRTGERVHRVPKPKKIKAALRVGARVYHLGRFTTKAEAEEAKNAARFRVSVGLDPLGRENP